MSKSSEVIHAKIKIYVAKQNKKYEQQKRNINKRIKECKEEQIFIKIYGSSVRYIPNYNYDEPILAYKKAMDKDIERIALMKNHFDNPERWLIQQPSCLLQLANNLEMLHNVKINFISKKFELEKLLAQKRILPTMNDIYKGKAFPWSLKCSQLEIEAHKECLEQIENSRKMTCQVLNVYLKKLGHRELNFNDNFSAEKKLQKSKEPQKKIKKDTIKIKSSMKRFQSSYPQ